MKEQLDKMIQDAVKTNDSLMEVLKINYEIKYDNAETSDEILKVNKWYNDKKKEYSDLFIKQIKVIDEMSKEYYDGID